MSTNKLLDEAKALLKFAQENPKEFGEALNKVMGATASGPALTSNLGSSIAAGIRGSTPPVKKDDKPHFHNSPEDKAHDIVEEDETPKDAVEDLDTKEQKEKMFHHLRSLKDKTKHRSEENRKVGQKHVEKAEIEKEEAKQSKKGPFAHTQQEKGVHQSFGGKSSKMGHMTRGHYSHGNKELNRQNAIKEANRVLGELKSMPKPNLPKSEKVIKEEEKPFRGYNKNKHSKEGGLNDKYREKYNRETGSDLKRPVTGDVKAGSKAAKRRKSFCARMSGVKGPTSKDGELTPKGAALKRWKCSKAEETEKRCWEGYEPTPGKKAYSKGSCRPVKKDEMDKCGDMEKEEMEKAKIYSFKTKKLLSDQGQPAKTTPPKGDLKAVSGKSGKIPKKWHPPGFLDVKKDEMDKCGDMEKAKAEMDKCGDIQEAKAEKLSKPKIKKYSKEEIKKALSEEYKPKHAQEKKCE